MLVSCPSGSVFPLPVGVDYIKIPSIVKVDTEVWRLRNLRLDHDQAKALRASLILKAADVFNPDLFLADHIPGGVWGELLPTLRLLKERGAFTALGVRDILDSPGVTQAAWKSKGFYEAIEWYYDKVLIYGCPQVFDTVTQYGLDTPRLAEKVRYCGFVCSDEPYATCERMRSELRVSKDRLVLITAGGGYDAFPMMQACLRAFRLFGKNLPFEVLLITGPLMAPEQQEELRSQAASLGVWVRTRVEDSLSYINAADLVVTMAGYNSLCEILRLKKKALVIPRDGPSAEQTTRARILAERGLIDVVYMSEYTPQFLADRITADLARTDLPSEQGAIELDGAREAAARLMELWEGNGASRRLVAQSAFRPGAAA
jgi:predicted glycosyltransferase